MRIKAAAGLFKLFLLSGLLVYAAPTPQPLADFYPIAVWYGGGKARAPMQELDARSRRKSWKDDLEQIRSLGFPAVKTWVEWASSEPSEGTYRFENLDQLLELADEAGLRVIIQLYVDSAPDWLGEKYPEARFVAQNGNPIPSQAAPGYCTDHPEISRHVASFYSAVAQVARKHRSFYAYDLWSEPHIINWAVINYIPDPQFCFCPSTLAEFRRWLSSKYGDLNHLNASWYRGFERWDQVEPPRFGTILSYTDFIDWKNFISDKLARDLRHRYDAVKREDPDHLATSHAAVPSIFTSPYAGDGTPDDWKMAAVVDYYGTSLYPKHSSSAAPWSTLRRAGSIDFIRSSGRRNRGFYIGELQAGFGTTGVKVGEPVTPEDLEDWTWSVVARGARSIAYYAYYPMSSGYESGGYGLVELDGTLTDRSKRAGDIAALLNRHAEFFNSADPEPADAAILYNPLAHLVGGEQSGGIRGGVRDSLFGYYRIFHERNIPVDFVHAADLERGDWGRYKLLIVPYPIMLSTKAADAIDRFVREGGRVLAEARAAWNDERGRATAVIPGSGLDRVFGCREEQVRPRARGAILITHSFSPRSRRWIASKEPASAGGSREISGAIYEEILKLTSPDATILATFREGGPAVVHHRYGKGETVLVGSFPGIAHESQPSSGFAEFMGEILEWAAVAPPFSIHPSGGGIVPELRILQGPRGTLLLVFNREMSTREYRLARGKTSLPQSLQVWSGGTPATLEKDRSALTVRIPPRRVAVLFLGS